MMKILIVEDEVLIALDLECAIVEAGHECVGIAPNRMAALAIAPNADVALVDLNLRDGATGERLGAELAEEFGLTVVYTTANPEDLGSGIAGTLGVLPKPVSAMEVCQLIGFLAGHRFAGLQAEPPCRFTRFT